MLRLDETTAQKLQELVAQFGMARAEIMRQLVAQATPEDFPPSWHLAMTERRRRLIKVKLYSKQAVLDSLTRYLQMLDLEERVKALEEALAQQRNRHPWR